MALSTVNFKDFIRAGVGMSPAAARLADAINAIISAIGSTPNWGAGVQDIAALKAVAAADRADKQGRVVEDNGLGAESIYVFDSGSTAGGDDINVVVPTAGTGRWLLAYQGNAAVLPIVNKTGVSITKGRAVYPVGWDTTTGCLSVALADSTDAAKQAIGVLTATVANNATGAASQAFKLSASGLDTTLAAVGAAVYYTSGGVLSLSAPTAPAPQQIVGRVRTLAASGVLAIGFEPVQPSSVVVGALASLTTTDKSSAVAAINEVDAHADTAQTTANAALPSASIVHAQVTVPNAGNPLAIALPAGFVVGKPCWGCVQTDPTTNLVGVGHIWADAVNLNVRLFGGVGAGDPGASGALVNVWQDKR